MTFRVKYFLPVVRLGSALIQPSPVFAARLVVVERTALWTIPARVVISLARWRVIAKTPRLNLKFASALSSRTRMMQVFFLVISWLLRMSLPQCPAMKEKIQSYFLSRIVFHNDPLSAVTSASVFMHAHDTTVYCIGDTADNTVASLNKALSDGTEQMVSRNLFYPSLSKEGSYTIDEKTTHRAAKFCDNWRGLNRVGETHSSFGRSYRWPAFLVT